MCLPRQQLDVANLVENSFRIPRQMDHFLHALQQDVGKCSVVLNDFGYMDHVCATLVLYIVGLHQMLRNQKSNKVNIVMPIYTN